ncbi:MAG: PAS domain S-box protein, partial [bacterium]|nr:PAS domain S-box protein [bacterium]
QGLANLRSRESEKRYRLIAENMADVVWTLDINLDFTYISPSIYQQRGYTVEQAMAQSLNEIMTPESLKKVRSLLEQKLALIQAGDAAGWAAATFEVEQYCRDGTIIWTDNNAKILPGPDKQPAGILGVSRDITERKWAEYRLKKIFNNTHDAIFIHDLEGKVIDVNDKMCQMYGVTKQQAGLMTIQDVSSAGMSMEAVSKKWQKALNGEKVLFE